jgi:hypothetical protein
MNMHEVFREGAKNGARGGLHLIRSLREGAAGFPTCCIADFPIGGWSEGRGCQLGLPPAGWETRETADWEVCGAKNGAPS